MNVINFNNNGKKCLLRERCDEDGVWIGGEGELKDLFSSFRTGIPRPPKNNRLEFLQWECSTRASLTILFLKSIRF